MVVKKKDKELVRTAGAITTRGYRALYQRALSWLRLTSKQDTMSMMSRTIRAARAKGFVAWS